MRKSAGVILCLAVLWACGGSSGTPTSPSNGSNSSSSSPTASPTADGATAAPAPTGAATAEVSGPIDSLTGSAATFQFKIGSRVIHGTSATTFDRGGDRPASFADLKNGSSVEVKGQQADGFVQATRIHIEDDEAAPAPKANPDDDNDNDDDNEPEVENEAEAKGTLTALTGSCPALTFNVGTTKVMTSSATRFDDVTCSSLKNNDRVEAKGTKRSDGVLQATRVERK